LHLPVCRGDNKLIFPINIFFILLQTNCDEKTSCSFLAGIFNLLLFTRA
jgi:hypothetical protein